MAGFVFFLFTQTSIQPTHRKQKTHGIAQKKQRHEKITISCKERWRKQPHKIARNAEHGNGGKDFSIHNKKSEASQDLA